MADFLYLVVIAALLCFVIGLPGGNQSKFFNLLFLLLAPPAGILLAELDARYRRWHRHAARAALALAVVPTVLLTLWGFASERAQPAGGATWHSPSEAEREALRWIREESSPSTAFVDPRLEFETWDAVSDGAHNSNTDLIYLNGYFYLVHQTSPYHLGSQQSRLVVRRSRHARSWIKNPLPVPRVTTPSAATTSPARVTH